MTDASKIAQDREPATTLTGLATMPESMTRLASLSVVDAQDGFETEMPDVVPLLGLEPADTEKAGENFPVEVESTRSPPLAPLLGTISFHVEET